MANRENLSASLLMALGHVLDGMNDPLDVDELLVVLVALQADEHERAAAVNMLSWCDPYN